MNPGKGFPSIQQQSRPNKEVVLMVGMGGLNPWNIIITTNTVIHNSMSIKPNENWCDKENTRAEAVVVVG